MLITAHQFQTPRVMPLVVDYEEGAQPDVVLRVAQTDVERIIRALDEASVSFAPSPGGSRTAAVYRRLSAEIRHQAF
jgi:hypothetical protein